MCQIIKKTPTASTNNQNPSSQQSTPNNSSAEKSQSTSNSPSTSNANTTSGGWSFDGSKWTSSGSAPARNNPIQLKTPVDLAKATAILYPGQTRGGDYKPHGGFRFDNSQNNDITVTIPLDVTLTKGSRYIEQGELQVYLFIISPCGIAYKFDHLASLSPKFQAEVNKLPEAKVDDSRTTNFSPNISVRTGEILATSVGFTQNNNVGVDFGVFRFTQNKCFSERYDVG